MWNKIKNIYIRTQKVRPIGWTPWANTVAYIPLKDDLLDHWPNQYTLTNSWGLVTIVNDKANIGVWYFNGGARLLNTSISSWLPLWTTAKTISCYVRFNYIGSTQAQNIVWFWRWWWGTDSANKSFFLYRDSSKKLAFTTWWGVNDHHTSITTSDDTWYNLLATYDGTDYKVYVNWVLNISGTITPNTDGTTIVIGWTSDSRSWYENYVTWYISEIIIENQSWTADQITAYYNQTKWNYGL